MANEVTTDETNKTSTVPCCFDMVEAKTAKGGGHVTMGVPAEAITKIMHGDYKPILILLDYKEYKRLEAVPLEDKAERYEKALKEISERYPSSNAGFTAREALTLKTTTDENT